jgi:hypothetical protein
MSFLPSPSVGPAILIDVDIFFLGFTVQPLRLCSWRECYPLRNIRWTGTGAV